MLLQSGVVFRGPLVQRGYLEKEGVRIDIRCAKGDEDKQKNEGGIKKVVIADALLHQQ